MSSEELQVGDPRTFIGECEQMNLDDLRDKMFGVAVGLGKRSDKKFLCASLRAPLDFFQMVEAVANVYQSEQMHARAFILSSKQEVPLRFLDECTIDFIEATYQDIIIDGMLAGDLNSHKEYTCKAGFILDEEIVDAQQHPTTESP